MYTQCEILIYESIMFMLFSISEKVVSEKQTLTQATHKETEYLWCR
jgi:hypothetical protein